MDYKKIMTVGQASRYTGLSKDRVRLLCKLGIFKFFRHHDNRQISGDSINEFMVKLWAGEVQLPDFPHVEKRREDKDKVKKARETGDLDPLRDWSVPEDES